MSGIKRKREYSLALLTLSAALMFGCARGVDKEVDEVTAAFEAAKQSDAAQYAKEAYAKAEEAYSNAMAEVDEQGQRIFLLRSYDRAAKLLSEAKDAAELAKTRSEDRREEMKVYSDDLIKDAKGAVVSARSKVTRRSRRSVPSLEAELDTADQLLFDAEQAWKEGQYLAARDKAEDAKAKADEVLENVSRATKRG